MGSRTMEKEIMTEIKRIIDILKQHALENQCGHYDRCAKALSQYVIKARIEELEKTLGMNEKWQEKRIAELKKGQK